MENTEGNSSGHPLKTVFDRSSAIKMFVREILGGAAARQRMNASGTFLGTVVLHLVGAKLDCALGGGRITHRPYSAAFSPASSVGNYLVADAAVYVTTAPDEAIIRKCKTNLRSGMRPVIVTVNAKVATAEGLADNAGIAERIDIFDIEQFLSLNIYQLGRFEPEGCRTAIEDIIRRYNEIVDDVETDPSLRIEVKGDETRPTKKSNHARGQKSRHCA